ncbi:hypothetical protein H101_07947 [Trichophyton interdigitale H6]|nr:hypothetical protein H101_07947 [Trichophyton interdigitale H6]
MVIITKTHIQPLPDALATLLLADLPLRILTSIHHVVLPLVRSLELAAGLLEGIGLSTTTIFALAIISLLSPTSSVFPLGELGDINDINNTSNSMTTTSEAGNLSYPAMDKVFDINTVPWDGFNSEKVSGQLSYPAKSPCCL